MANIWCRNGAVDSEGNLWMSAYPYNGLYKCGLDSKKMEFICTFEYEEALQADLYRGIVCAGDRVVIIPQWAHKIAVYEKKDSKVKYYDFPSDIKPADNQRYSTSVYYGDCVCLIPMYSNVEIVKFDVRDGFVYNTKIDLKRMMGWQSDYWIDDAILIHRHLYILIREAQVIVDVDIERKTCVSLNVSLFEDDKSAGLVCGYKRCLFYIDNTVYMWNREKGKYEVFALFPKHTFNKMWCLEERIYGFVWDKPEIDVYDIRTRRISSIADGKRQICCPMGWKYIWPLDTVQNSLICISYHSGDLLKIEGDKITDRIKSDGDMPPVCDTEYYQRKNICVEGYHERLNLSDFAEYVKNLNTTMNVYVQEDIGKRVFEEIILKEIQNDY